MLSVLYDAATGAPTKIIEERSKRHSNPSTAQKLPSKTKIHGTVRENNPDYYKYVATEKGFVKFRASADDPEEIPTIEIYDSKMKILRWTDDSTALTTFKPLNLKKGSAYNSLNSATKLSLNKKVTGMITNADLYTVADDIDYFKFKAPSAGTYKFIFNYSYGGDIDDGWRVSLIDKKRM